MTGVTVRTPSTFCARGTKAGAGPAGRWLKSTSGVSSSDDGMTGGLCPRGYGVCARGIRSPDRLAGGLGMTGREVAAVRTVVLAAGTTGAAVGAVYAQL